MALTNQTKDLLTKKLRFSKEQIGRLEGNPDLEREMINLLNILKMSPEKKEIRQYAHVQFRKIRKSLAIDQPNHNEFLRQARSAYYTFKRTR